MTSGLAEINKALDDIIVNEAGLRFQRLAIALSKQRWPDVIATEVHKDLGEDGLGHPFLTTGGKKFSIACSITSEYGKIKADADRIYKRGISLDFMVFYTPGKPSNETVQKWNERFTNDFVSELIVISREDIIQELLKPKNEWMCGVFLKLPTIASPNIDKVTEKCTAAAARIIEKWKRLARYEPCSLIDLEAATLDDKDRHTGQVLDPLAIVTHLTDGGRIVLKGSPGAGKTTTLIRISELLLVNEQQKIPLLIALPDWIESGDDVITFVSKHPDLVAENVTPSDIALLHEHGRLVCLFNGWNEIDPSLLPQAGRRLQQVDRELTAAGIILATRENYVTPPLLGKLNLVLQPLSDTQRRTYIANALSENEDELVTAIEASHTLNAITRTPLFISEIVLLYKSGADIPENKYGVLQSATIRIEQREEHSVALQTEPISGRAKEYLSELAFAMTKSGRTAMHYDQALKVINTVNKLLLEDERIGAMFNPGPIVDALCAHHLLEKSVYPVNSVHFTHQQFQEFYASTKLRNQLTALCTQENQDEIRAFQKNIINIPIWEEPLKLLAEEVREVITANGKLTPSEVDPLVASQRLVEWTIPIDPVFAAELVRILGEDLWIQVKNGIESYFRAWYECPYEYHKVCALAAMLATGVDEFSDILWTLLESPDKQVRLLTYKMRAQRFLSCLGSSWKERICGWDDERRTEFVNQLSYNGHPDISDVFQDFAQTDPSAKVRVTAINAVGWYSSRDKLWQILRDCDDETFKLVVQHDFLLKKLSEDLVPRVRATYRQLLSETKHPNERLRIFLRMMDFDGTETAILLKAELDKYPIDERTDPGFSNLYKAVARIASEDPGWASKWVALKQAEGKLYGESWSALIGTVPSDIIDAVIHEILKPECPDYKALMVQGLIRRGASKEHARIILRTLIEKHVQSSNLKGQLTKDERSSYFRLKNVARELSWQILIEVLIEDYSKPSNSSQLRVILDLIGCAALERNTTQLEVTPDKLDKFRAILRCYSKQVLSGNDYGGGLKADLSCALGIFGEKEDIGLIRKIIDADIERIQQGLELWRQRANSDPRAQGAQTRWSNWHIRALCRLDPENADQQLIELLNEPEYEEDACRGLVQLLKCNVPKEEFSWGSKQLRIGSAIQERKYLNATKRKQYSAILTEHIKNLLEIHKKEKKDSLTGRLCQLAHILASIGESNEVSLILEVLQIPCDYGTWIRIETLVRLIKNGNRLETNEIETIISQIITSLIKQGIYNNQNIHSLARCLSILACTSDISRAIAIIKQFVSKYQLGYDMRVVIGTLGYTSSSEAANYLIELAQNASICAHLGRELIQALSNLDVPESKRAIFSIIDPTIQSVQLKFSNKNFEMEIAAEAIANWFGKDVQLKKRIFDLCGERLTKDQREVLADVINRLATTEVVVAGLNLISEQAAEPVPFFLKEAIEMSVTERIPLEDIPNIYNVRPRENITVIKKLFDMACDDEARCTSAFDLLGRIYYLRLEHGRPPMEPRHPNIERVEPWPPFEFCQN